MIPQRFFSSRLFRGVLVVAALLALGPAVYGLVWWARYPKVPDAAAIEPSDAIDFIGTDDFGRMTEAHRKRYVLTVIERLRGKPFPALVNLALTGDAAKRRAVVGNVNKLTSEADREELGGAFMRVFLDKFYDLPKTDRDTYLTTWALAEKLGSGRRRPTTGPSTRPQPRLPSSAEVEKGMTRFLSHQPPRATAQMGQFMEDMRKKRDMVGVKQPWG